jgi:ferredoxin-NADP reductase
MSAMIKDHTATLRSKKQLAGHIWSFTFDLPVGDETIFEAGQYMILKVGNNYRQYSIATPTSQKNSFDLVVEILENGVGSDFLKVLPDGGQAQFKGPAGVFILRNSAPPVDKIFLATGTGIAPIRSMIMTHLEENRPGKLFLFFGLRNRADVYFEQEFSVLAQVHPQFQFKICLSKEESLEGLDQYFAQGRVNISLEQLWQQRSIQEFEYYICGGRTAVDSLKDYVIAKGAPTDRVFFERFTL